MGFGDFFASLFGNNQIDARAPEAVASDQQRNAQAAQMMQEYSNANANPNYALGNPQQQALQEQELARDVRNRTGAAGAGGSGFESDAIRKAIVDFRISQIAQRQQALNNLRTGMIQATQGWQQPMQIQTGIGRQFGNALAGRAASQVGNELFGPDQNQMAQQRQQSAELGSQLGGNGFRNPGTQGGGPGNGMNVNPWGMEGV